jgi:hypothetical protein
VIRLLGKLTAPRQLPVLDALPATKSEAPVQNGAANEGANGTTKPDEHIQVLRKSDIDRGV